MKKDKRTHQYHLFLNDSEDAKFKEKSKGYSNMSSMIRDAVNRLNDQKATGLLDALNGLSSLIQSFGSELSKQGGNLNQVVKRANELVYSGDLDKNYFEKVILPTIKETQKIIFEIKKEQSKIFKELTKL